MSEVFIATEPDGSKWVSLEDYEVMNKIALENKLIVEHYQKLLGVYTNTEALAKIVELQQHAAQQGVQADVCHSCGTTYTPSAQYCHNCGTRR